MVVLTDELLEELENGGGSMEKTKKSKDRYYKYLCEYISNVEEDPREIDAIEDKKLGKYFSNYLFRMRILKKVKLDNGDTEEVEMWPKRNTAEYAKSMIKNSFHEKHGIDFSDPFKTSSSPILRKIGRAFARRSSQKVIIF